MEHRLFSFITGNGRGKPLISQRQKFQIAYRKPGGEGGIRTPDRLAPMPHFECGAFNRSATSPKAPAGKAQITWARRALQAWTGAPLSRRRFRLQAVWMRNENDVVAGVHIMDFPGDAARKIG